MSTYAVTLAVALLPRIVAAQGSPVADALRDFTASEGKNLTAAAELMPADKYGYRPTPAQMSFGAVVVHLAGGNDFFCSAIAGTKPPTRSAIDTTASKEALVARLKETFDYCGKELASVDDSKLGEQLPWFGGKSTKTRAAFMMITAADWADHYSQSANYLRLNGILPPTSKPKTAMKM
ncbi:MAG TPA: DinB family protein [Vicinamibacterales bacterium]